MAKFWEVIAGKSTYDGKKVVEVKDTKKGRWVKTEDGKEYFGYNTKDEPNHDAPSWKNWFGQGGN
jgi:hypothetical protein